LNCSVFSKASVVNSGAPVSWLDVTLIVDSRRCSVAASCPRVWRVGESLKTIINCRPVNAASHVDAVWPRKWRERIQELESAVVVGSGKLGVVSEKGRKRAMYKVKSVNKASANFQ
jgi:hypothetical protein